MSHDKHEAQIRKKLISGTKWAVAVRIATQAFSWVVTLIMVRLLLPVDYGLNAMIEVPIELLMLVSTQDGPRKTSSSMTVPPYIDTLF